MHFLVLLVFHAIIYSVIFHLLGQMTVNELVGLGGTVFVLLAAWQLSPMRWRGRRRRW